MFVLLPEDEFQTCLDLECYFQYEVESFLHAIVVVIMETNYSRSTSTMLGFIVVAFEHLPWYDRGSQKFCCTLFRQQYADLVFMSLAVTLSMEVDHSLWVSFQRISLESKLLQPRYEQFSTHHKNPSHGAKILDKAPRTRSIFVELNTNRSRINRNPNNTETSSLLVSWELLSQT